MSGEIVVEDMETTVELFISLIMGIPTRLAAFGIIRKPEFERRRIRQAVKLFLNGIKENPS